VTVGAFGSPADGSISSRSSGAVNQAGFGTGYAGNGNIKLAAFDRQPAPGPVVTMRTSEPNVVPPVVTFEPRPVYTPEAAQARVQGEVTLRVCFLATGRVEVLEVVQGLSLGLDDQAKRAAEGIRFTPATRGGVPTDHVTLIHVLFQLS
jgi:TonB family protein